MHKFKCKCGGVIGMDESICGITHTYPACNAFDAIDLDELIKTPGALARTIYAMTAKIEA